MPIANATTPESNLGLRPEVLGGTLRAVTRAVRVCRLVQRGPGGAGGQAGVGGPTPIVKGDGSVVTIGDFAAQAVIVRTLVDELAGVWPELPIVGEESSAYLRSDEGRGACASALAAVRDSGAWPDATESAMLDALERGAFRAGDAPLPGAFVTLDPIDGTKGFVGRRQYAVCLAVVEHGRPTLGVVACPNLDPDPRGALDANHPVGSFFFAQAGRGTWSLPGDLDAARVRVDARGVVEGATRVVRPAWDASRAPSVTFSYAPTPGRVAQLEALRVELGAMREPTQLDSQCKYAVVARGQADVYFRPTRQSGSENIWDHASGMLLVQEAGCVTSDTRGQALDYSREKMVNARGLLAAPEPLHAQVIAALARLTKP